MVEKKTETVGQRRTHARAGVRTAHNSRTQGQRTRRHNNTSPHNKPSGPRRTQKDTRRTQKKSRNGDNHRRPTVPKRDPGLRPVPPVTGDSIRIIPLGGVEEVGKNMTIIENKDDIFIFDIGFQFSEAETPGIDYILPDTRYLEERKSKIRGAIITHGHLDHIGGIPYLMEKLGNPTLYSRGFTALMIKKRQEEFPHLPPLDIKIVEPGQSIKLGSTTIKFFAVTHSIPDSMGVIVSTPHGNIVISGDLRLEHNAGVPSEKEEKNWGEIGKGDNLLFIGDSTNAENPGFSVSDSVIFATIEKIIREASSRLIIGTFASQVERTIRIVKMCEKYNKKVVAEGRSIKTNIEISKIAGLLKPKEDTFIPIQEADRYPADRIVVLATGGQGEEFAALARMGRGDHKYIKLTDRDTIVLSSSVIPGNELSVQKLKDNLYRHGVKIIHYKVSDVHASGHANQGELLWINKQVGAKFFMPAYGFHSMLRVHAEVGVEAGIPKENIIIPDNGTIIDIVGGKEIVILKERAPSNLVMVDGFYVGDTQEAVIRDRNALAQDGIFVIIAIVDTRTGLVRKSPDIISRGFVYLRESQDLLRQSRFIVKKTIEDSAKKMRPIDFEHIKDKVTDDISKFLAQQTAKRPMVLPVILGV